MKDLYGVTVSSSMISEVTESVWEAVQAWRNRPLEPIYPILWLDGIVVKVRDGKHLENCSVHVMLGMDMDGKKDVLGIGWLATSPRSFGIRS